MYPFRKECDIAELYLTADILITDYSSVMFDYSILRRPMFFYTYDLDYYRGILRGFYFDFEEEAPGPIVQTTEALIQAIASYQEEEWKEKAEAFRENYNTADNGTASEQIVELVASICCGRGKRGGRPE